MQNCMGGKAVLLSPYRLSDGTTPLASIKASVLSRAEFLFSPTPCEGSDGLVLAARDIWSHLGG